MFLLPSSGDILLGFNYDLTRFESGVFKNVLERIETINNNTNDQNATLHIDNLTYSIKDRSVFQFAIKERVFIVIKAV